MTEAAAGAPRDWRAYYAKTAGRPPRDTLLLALDRFEAEGRAPGFALDLGCGGGRDTVELLRRGWRTLAVDAEPVAVEVLRERAGLNGLLETRVARFEETDLPACDLVNASFSLPLCPPAAFHALWPRIAVALRPGGRLSCQLFGERDSFAGDPAIATMPEAEARALLEGWEVEMFRVEEEDSVTPWGSAKHWHLFHLVARRPD